jgi:branched-chain amino acid transport system ATP-binding protein
MVRDSDKQRLVGPDETAVVATAVLEVSYITVDYGAGPALSDFSLSVGNGEAVAVVGANGAGKSTLLRAVSGWVQPRAGDVWLNGSNLVGQPPYKVARRGLVHVPEGRCVFPDLTVEENLQLGHRKGSGRIDELRDEAFDIFPRLRERRGQVAGSLSGGEQQMLAIGRGLMAKPEVLMLDEPSLGLAPVVINEVFEALAVIRGSGVGILIVEQNVQSALTFADRGYVLSRGLCVLEGEGTALLARDDLMSAYLVQERPEDKGMSL